MGDYLPQNEGNYPIMGNEKIGYSLHHLYPTQRWSVGMYYSPDFDISRTNISNETEQVDPVHYNKVISASHNAQSQAVKEEADLIEYIRKQNEQVRSPTKDALRAKLKLLDSRIMTDEYDSQYNATTPSNVDPNTDETTASGLGSRDEVGNLGRELGSLDNSNKTPSEQTILEQNEGNNREGYTSMNTPKKCGCKSSSKMFWIYVTILVLLIAFVWYRYVDRK